MEKRWGFDGLRSDPYYNPNLSLDAENYTLAWPPRVHSFESALSGSGMEGASHAHDGPF